MPRPPNDPIDRLRDAEETARYSRQCIEITEVLAVRTDGDPVGDAKRLASLSREARRVVSQKGER